MAFMALVMMVVIFGLPAIYFSRKCYYTAKDGCLEERGKRIWFLNLLIPALIPGFFLGVALGAITNGLAPIFWKSSSDVITGCLYAAYGLTGMLAYVFFVRRSWVNQVWTGKLKKIKPKEMIPT